MPVKGRGRKCIGDIFIPGIDQTAHGACLTLRLEDTDTIHLQFRAVHLLSIDGIHLAGDRLYFCGLPKEVILQSRKQLLVNIMTITSVTLQPKR